MAKLVIQRPNASAAATTLIMVPPACIGEHIQPSETSVDKQGPRRQILQARSRQAEGNMRSGKPLSGIKVVQTEHIVAAPYAGVYSL